MTEKRAREWRKKIEAAAMHLPDEEAVDSVELFPEWEADGPSYSVGDRVRYDGLLYKCVQAHIPQESWTPDTAVSLWIRVAKPEEWPEWIQPVGAEGAYHVGDKVNHNEKHWVSNTDNNVWEPGVYGWALLNDGGEAKWK